MKRMSHSYPIDPGRRSTRPGPAACLVTVLGLFLSAGLAQADGVVQFADTLLAVKEGERETLTVVRSGSLTGTVSVLLNVGVAGTARFGTDFDIELPLGVVQIEDGETFAHVDVIGLSDNNIEGTEFATLSLSSPSDATLGAADKLNLDVLDDQSAPTELSYSTQGILRIQEGEDQDVDVSRSGSDGNAEIDVSGQPDSATLGVDYVDVTQTLLFDNDEQSRNFTLSALNDDLFEGTEQFTLVLANGIPEDQVVPGGRSRLVLLEDAEPDQPGEFDIEVTGDASVPETAGNVSFRVNRRRASTGTATVDYVTADGADDDPAIAGTDYVAATETLTFGNGDTSQSFDITILDDPDQRGEQREFDVYIANPGNLANLDPDRLGVTITIEEDDGGGSNSDCDFFCNDICFIATAAYGSKMDPHVVSLRRFRDNVLLRIGPGRAFVEAYYRYSPPLAAYIAERDALRAVVRAALWPVVFTVEHPAGALSFLSITLVGLNLRRRRLRGRLAEHESAPRAGIARIPFEP